MAKIYSTVSRDDGTYREEELPLGVLALVVVGQVGVDGGVSADLHHESAAQMTYLRVQLLDRKLRGDQTAAGVTYLGVVGHGGSAAVGVPQE